MANGRFILNSAGRPVECEDLTKWGRWMQTADRKVAFDTFGPTRISTVFLGLDHSWDDGPPVLWETMVFNGPLDGEQDRYTSLEDAKAGHAAMVEKVRTAQNSPRAS